MAPTPAPGRAPTRVVMHHKGVQELLQAPGVRADLRRRAEAVAEAVRADAGEPQGFPIEVFVYDDTITAPRRVGGRRRTAVRVGHPTAAGREIANQLLLASLDAAR